MRSYIPTGEIILRTSPTISSVGTALNLMIRARRNSVKLLVTLLLLCSTNAYSQGRISLAVFPFISSDISNEEAITLSRRLSANLARSDSINVIDRETVEMILNEQDFQFNDPGTDERADEMGRLVGVEYMVVGTIGQIGSFFTINYRILDIGAGRMFTTGSYDIQGEIGLLLTDGMAEVAKRISSQFGIGSADISDRSRTNSSTAATSASAGRLRTGLLNIAVVQFQDKGSLGIEDAGEIVAGWMNGSLHKTGVFTLYERVLLQDVLAEQNIGLTGVMDESTTIEIGKIFGVEAIVTGTISRFASTFSIVARLIDTETGKVIATAEIKTKDIDALAEATDGLAMELAKEPER